MLPGSLFRGVFLTTEDTEVTEEGLAIFCVSFLLSLVSFLWHGCHVPLTPDPSPPFRGRGEDFVFFVVRLWMPGGRLTGLIGLMGLIVLMWSGSRVTEPEFLRVCFFLSGDGVFCGCVQGQCW